MRIPYQAEGGQQQQKHAQRKEQRNETDAYFGWHRFGEAHQIGHLIGQTIDALLEPQNGEDDVREVGHLLDIEHLTDGQIDLDASTHTQSGAHFLVERRK